MRVQSGWLTAVCLLFIPGSALAQPVTGSIDQAWARLKRVAESTGGLQHEDGYMSDFVGVPLTTAIGAIAGAGLAAVTNHQEVLFRRAIPVAKVTVSPVFDREHRVTLSLHPTVDRNRRALLFMARW